MAMLLLEGRLRLAISTSHDSHMLTTSLLLCVLQKLKKKGNDVTKGDVAKLVICAEELQLCDVKSAGQYFRLYSRDIHSVKVVFFLYYSRYERCFCSC
jgi:hypothetical protein